MLVAWAFPFALGLLLLLSFVGAASLFYSFECVFLTKLFKAVLMLVCVMLALCMLSACEELPGRRQVSSLIWIGGYLLAPVAQIYVCLLLSKQRIQLQQAPQREGLVSLIPWIGLSLWAVSSAWLCFGGK